MASEKKNKPNKAAASSIPGRSWLGRVYVGLQLIPRGAVLTIIGPVLLAIFGYIGWHAWGSQHFNRAFFALQVDHIDITPQPDWIRSNIVEEVFRNSGLNDVSLLDRDATAKIAHAFDTHSWIQETTRVQKLADMRVCVNVLYRRPLAMVYYDPPGDSPFQEAGDTQVFFYPVDENAVILPTEDFAGQVFDYFLIYAANASFNPVTGSALNETRISDALALCKFLEPYRIELSLDRIYAYREDRSIGAINSVLEIETRDRKRFVWGGPPGKEADGEASPSEKLERLIKCCKVASSPADIGSSFDLRGTNITVSHQR